jgi:hypothetical protein
MEKSDIEEIFSSFLVEEMTMAPKILMIWKNKEGLLFEFRMKVSREFLQDLNGILKDNTPYDLIIDYPENNKEISLDYLLNLSKDEGSAYGFTWGEELNKKLLPYIRNEKLNKLIN